MEGTDMGYENEMKIEFDSRSCNEGFIRVAVSAFMTQLNPTLEEVADVKTAVSEAVTNCIVHAYDGKVEKITVSCHIEGNALNAIVVASGGCLRCGFFCGLHTLADKKTKFFARHHSDGLLK